VLSYSKGPDVPLLDLTVGQQLAETARRWPNRDAVVARHQQQRLTWSELLQAADSVGRGLRDLGLRENDRVGLWATNCLEWVIVHFACARAGLVLVNVNTASRAHELAFILNKSGMKALFLHESDQRANFAEILAEARQGSALNTPSVSAVPSGLDYAQGPLPFLPSLGRAMFSTSNTLQAQRVHPKA
jgi:fatty-acyl-CoA synthase